jgi:type II secretory pathway pseudopilin PulG
MIRQRVARVGAATRARRADRLGFSHRAGASGFTLLELAVILFIVGLMITIAIPYAGGYRQAQLRSVARRLAGRASYLFDQAEAQKVVLRLIFNLDNESYSVARLDPYAAVPAFAPDNGPAGHPVKLPPAIAIRDVTVANVGSFNAGLVATQFYPEGYVDATVIHLIDASGDVMTLAFNPTTGQVLINNGDLTLNQMLTQ